MTPITKPGKIIMGGKPFQLSVLLQYYPFGLLKLLNNLFQFDFLKIYFYKKAYFSGEKGLVMKSTAPESYPLKI